MSWRILALVGVITILACDDPDDPVPASPPAAAPSGGGAFLAASLNALPRCNNCEASLAPSGLSFFGSMANDSNELLSPNATLVARDLSVKVAVAPGRGASRRFILNYVPFSARGLECTIAGDATTCNSGDQTMTIPPGSSVVMAVVNINNAPESKVWFGWRAE